MKRVLGILLCFVLMLTTMVGCGKGKKGFNLACMTGGCTSTDIEEYKNEVRELSEAGFKYLDLSLYSFRDDSIWMQDDWENKATELKEYADEQGVTFIQSHLPSCNPLDKELWTSTSSKYTIRAIEVCAALGIENAVIHPGQADDLTEKDAYFSALSEALKVLFPTIEKHKVNLLIENSTRMFLGNKYNFYTGASLKEFLDYLDHPLVHAVWDTGHANVEGHQYEDIIALGSHLKGLHIHNNDGRDDQHRSPLMGNMDMDGIMKALVEIDYQGYFTLEVSDTYIDVVVGRVGTGKDAKFEKALQKMEELSTEPRKMLYEVTKECLIAYDLFQE